MKKIKIYKDKTVTFKDQEKEYIKPSTVLNTSNFIYLYNIPVKPQKIN